MNATVMVARGSAAVTWELATILAEALNGLGLSAAVGEPESAAAGTPIIVFGQGAVSAPPISEDQARRAVVLLLAGPGTQAYDAAIGLAELAAGWFAVSPRTVTLLNAQGIRTDRFILGHADRWDTRSAANTSRPIDILHTGEVDEPGRRILTKVAPELAQVRSRMELTARRLNAPAAPAGFESSALLADATLTLSLNRWGETTLDWPTVVRAMCNGTVVIAERATGCGELVPGEHFLMTRPESIGPVIRACAADPQAVATMATAAYELCRSELAMNDSIERLATVAERSGARLKMTRGPAPPAVARNRASTGSPRLKFETVGVQSDPADAGPEVDVICIDHPAAGPVSLTRESLAGYGVRFNLHVGTIRTTERHRESRPTGRSVTSTSIAEARNDLVRRSSAPLLMFIDAGDEILGDALGQLAATLSNSTRSNFCLPIVARGSEDLIYPPLRNTSEDTVDSEGLPRGYMVRRSYLARLGPFVGVEDGADAVDRAFWRRAEAVGGHVALLPRVGLRLWQTTPAG